MDNNTRRAFLARYAAMAATAAAAAVLPGLTAAADELAPPPDPTPRLPMEPNVPLYGPPPQVLSPPVDSGRLRALYGPPPVGDRVDVPARPLTPGKDPPDIPK